MNIDLGKKKKNNAQAKKICFVSSLFQLLHSEMLRVHNLSGKKNIYAKYEIHMYISAYQFVAR